MTDREIRKFAEEAMFLSPPQGYDCLDLVLDFFDFFGIEYDHLAGNAVKLKNRDYINKIPEDPRESGDVVFLSGKTTGVEPHAGVLVNGGKGLLHFKGAAAGVVIESYELFLKSSLLRESMRIRILMEPENDQIKGLSQ